MDFDLTVVHSNELIDASYSLNVDEMRLVLLACSKIDSRKRAEGQVIEITPREFVDTFNVDPKNVYRCLRNAVKGIGRKPIQLPVIGTSKVKELFWLSYSEYDTSERGVCIRLKFNLDLEPYLYELHSNFTVMSLEQAAKLNTPFSYRLYQWLIKAKNLRSSKKGMSHQVILEIDWMKKQSGLHDKYDLWSKFKEKVIVPSVEKINADTDLSIIWTPLRSGRTINAIQFNYIIEAASIEKPLRPRLIRRPKVLKGSHEEGVWMRKNLALLLDYESKLKSYDQESKLSLPDLRKMAEYASIAEPELQQRLRQEIEERTTKKAA